MQPLIELDGTDRRMLQALQRDGRIPVVALAEEVGLSATPCQRRLKRLEDTGVIQRYTAVVDPVRLGLPVQAFALVALDSHAPPVLEAFHAALAQQPEVLAAYALSGDSDYLLHILASSLEGFGQFVTGTLMQMPGVRSARSSFVLFAPKPPVGVPV